MELSLKDIVSILLNKIWTIIIGILVGGVLAFIISSYFIEPVYQSSLSLYVFNADNKNDNMTANDLVTAQKLVNTYIAVLKTDKFLNQVIFDQGLDCTAKKLRDSLKMESITNTELFKVTVQSTNPSMALKIANSIVRLAPESLQTIVQTGRTEIVDTPVMAEKPSSPNIKFNTIIGVLLGAIGSTMISLMIYMFDTRIKSEEEVISRYNIPVLGSIPLCPEDKKND